MRWHSIQKNALFILGIVIAILFTNQVIAPGLKQAWFDYKTIAARKQIAKWMNNPYAGLDIGTWVATRDVITEAATEVPLAPTYHIELGKLHVLRGLIAHQDVTIRAIFYREAIGHFERALITQPNNYYSMANIVQFKSYIGEVDDTFKKYLITAAKLAPNEADIQITLLNGAYQAWPKLDDVTKKFVKTLRQAALTQQAANIAKLEAGYPAIQF